MRYSTIVAPVALAACVSAGDSYATTTWTTEVVSTLTTFCSSATSISINGKIHTITEATTLTITDCPCTLTHSAVATSAGVSSGPVATIVKTPVIPSVPVVLASSSTPSPVEAATSTPVAPAVILSTAGTAPASPLVPLSTAVPLAPYPVSNSTTLVPVGSASAGTVSVGSTASASAPSASVSNPVAHPGTKATFKGAADRVAASCLSLAALFGLAAAFLL